MDWTASLIFDPKEVEDEGMKAIAESKKALAELKNQQAGFKLEIQFNPKNEFSFSSKLNIFNNNNTIKS